MLNPYYDAANLTFNQAIDTLKLSVGKTILYTERQHKNTTGLDALAVRAAEPGFPLIPTQDPQMPIPSQSFNRLTLDSEGLVLNADGT